MTPKMAPAESSWTRVAADFVVAQPEWIISVLIGAPLKKHEIRLNSGSAFAWISLATELLFPFCVELRERRRMIGFKISEERACQVT